MSTSSLTQGSIARSLITLAMPIMLANLLQATYHLVDAFWVGKLGESAVAAVSVTFPVTFLLIALGTGFAVAGSTLIAQYVGANNRGMVNHVAAQTLFMTLFLSLVLAMIGILLAPHILNFMGVAEDVFAHALGFMRVSFVGVVFLFTFSMFQSVLRGIGEVAIPLYVVFASVVLNGILAPLFIFGFGTVPGYGVMGAAIATLITQALATTVGFIILFRGRCGIRVTLRDFIPDPVFLKRAFLLGFPASIEQSARALGIALMTFLITSFGTTAIASYGVGSNILQFVIIPAMGLSMAVSILVGQNIGAGNVERASAIARLGAWISFIGLTLVGTLIFWCAPQIVAIFVPGDAEVIRTGSTFIRTMSLTYGFLGVHFAYVGVFRGAGNMLATMIMALVSQWVLQFPIAYLLSKHTTLGVDGLWWAFPISNIIMAMISIAWYYKGDWKKISLLADEETVHVTKEILVEEGVRGV